MLARFRAIIARKERASCGRFGGGAVALNIDSNDNNGIGRGCRFPRQWGRFSFVCGRAGDDRCLGPGRADLRRRHRREGLAPSPESWSARSEPIQVAAGVVASSSR
jgi:hypothetical protein